MTSNEQLSQLYKTRFPEKELERKNAIWKVICEDYLQQFIAAGSLVVDIACGYGEFLNNITAKTRVGIDLNPDSARFLDSAVQFYNKDAMLVADIAHGQADVIFASNFLEHLPNKSVLDDLLKEVLGALKPGGTFIIVGPNLRYLPGEYWDFYDHHLGLTHLSLSEALELQGFELDLCIDRFLPYTTKSALPTHPLLVQCYLKFPLAWRILGKQFLLVARKPVAAS